MTRISHSLAILTIFALPPLLVAQQPAPGFAGTVIKVLDAGNLLVRPRDGRRLVPVRLIGLEAPRKSTREQEGQEPWGTRAQQFLSLLITRKDVRVESDLVATTDDGAARWGYVWLGGRLLNEEVLKAGHAVLDTRPPNVRHVERLQAAQQSARDGRLGIWDPAEPLPEPPAKFVATQANARETQKAGEEKFALKEFVEGCVVGNRGSKLYHVPGGRYYARAKTSANAIFFRNAEDARQAGYTPASR